MSNIIEYRDDQPPQNSYPQRIVSPTRASVCCVRQMAPIGTGAVEGGWRYQYKRCPVCGYTVRSFYAPSLRAEVEMVRQMRIALADVNLGSGDRRRRSPGEVARERAAARAWPAPAASRRVRASRTHPAPSLPPAA
jgi:hypothetical protein